MELWYNIRFQQEVLNILSLNLNRCRVLKRVGGHWVTGKGNRRKQVDGDKFVCLDQILNKDSCIVYSFGVSNDWTFDDQMDNTGLSEGFALSCQAIIYMY